MTTMHTMTARGNRPVWQFRREGDEDEHMDPNVRQTDMSVERLKKPGLLVRLLGWLLRPAVWETIRQHPQIDENREFDVPILGFRDALTGRNRHRGYGP